MKRIVSLLLALTLVFALASCGAGDDLSTYQNAISATNPSSVTVTTKLVAGDVELNGSYDITYADGAATVVYEYEKLNLDFEGDMVKTESGTSTVAADGTATGVDAAVTSAAKLAIKLDTSKIKSVVEARGILTCEILAANTAAVLGFAVDADVSLELRVTADGKVGSASLSYTTDAGAHTIVCTFD